jgi:hypothetical protein
MSQMNDEIEIRLEPLPPGFLRFRVMALLVGVIGLALSAAGWLMRPDAFARAYLFGYLFFLGLTLGSLAWVMIHHLVGGGWGRAIQRLAEAAAKNAVLMAVLFIPLAMSVKHLYPWANPDVVAHDVVLQHKAPYLNFQFWIIRAVIYFALWIGFAFAMAGMSSRYDRTRSPALAQRMRRLSAAGLLIYVLTMTFAGVDWIMSREAHYFSTIYGFIMVVGQAMSALLLLVVVLTLLLGREPLRSYVTRGHFNDLGNLMLTLVILFAYIGFAQFLISWTGNLQEEVKWYKPRMTGLYGFMGAVIIVFHFFVPFILLLMKHLKRHPELLARIAAVLLAVRLVDVAWQVAPTGQPLHSVVYLLLMVTAPVGIAGVWFALFLLNASGRPLLAVSEHAEPSESMEDQSDPEVGPHGEHHAHPA